jgi:hypothetical protein
MKYSLRALDNVYRADFSKPAGRIGAVLLSEGADRIFAESNKVYMADVLFTCWESRS